MIMYQIDLNPFVEMWWKRTVVKIKSPKEKYKIEAGQTQTSKKNLEVGSGDK